MLTPVKAIAKWCLECSGDGRTEVTLCWDEACPLWPYRLGCRPTSPRYHRRVKLAWDKGGAIVAELLAEGKNIQSYTKSTVKSGTFRGKPVKNRYAKA
jgi:hypothetical protein